MIPAIEKLARVNLGFYPTPITEAKHLSSVLGGPRILIKREDLSGLALGGNKCRKLEFILAYIQEQGYDALVCAGSTQSNFCPQAAAAARKLGIEPYFVLLKGVHNEVQGNLLLHDMMNSGLEIIEFSDMTRVGGDFIAGKLEAAAGRLRSQGYKPFIIRHDLPDIAPVIGAVGWVNAADEIQQQMMAKNIRVNYVVQANGTGGTLGAFTLGAKYLRADYRVIGIPVLYDKVEDARAAALRLGNAVSEYLGLNIKLERDDMEVYGQYIGEGYGKPTRACIDAIRLVAETEGIVLDPVYTGKAMAGLIDLISKGKFKSEDTVLFLHTGGIPVTFAYAEEVTAQSRRKS